MRAALVVAVAATGCGDALVTADYRGEPLISIEGRIVDFSNAAPGELLRASIFWSKTDEPSVVPAKLVEQPSIGTRVTFPATFELNVFEPPPLDRLPARSFHLGTILVYADVDGDDRFSDHELRGGAATLAILHTQETISSDRSPTGMAVPPGFTLVRLPLKCGYERTPEPGTNCGVTLGAPCRDDTECGAGVCILEDEFVRYPGGYCALDARHECRPSGGVTFDLFTPERFEPAEMFGRGCGTDLDCRMTAGYECYQQLGVCLPVEPLMIDIFPDYEQAPFCVEDWLAWGR